NREPGKIDGNQQLVRPKRFLETIFTLVTGFYSLLIAGLNTLFERIYLGARKKLSRSELG
ncbi:MAG TPA: hypothetical protein VNM37_22410, partial [Candidatus Dormibacteraeota bacterium]|nr:hypothetical protein [Candidatus Dormibacteraeota bacterium]